MKSIAVFFGGQSVEHDISIITGVLTANSLDKEKYLAVPVYVAQSGIWYTGKDLLDLDNFKKLNFKNLTQVSFVGGGKELYSIHKNKLKKITAVAVAVNCIHGERGEDGSLVGLLNMCNVPCVCPPLAPSSICMDKTLTKVFLQGIGVKALPSITVSRFEQLKTVTEKLGFPLIVKPAKLGSSIGISTANSVKELDSALSYALRYCQSVIVEPLIDGFVEINCAAYMDEKGLINVSECERPVGRTDILTFKDKYESGKRVFPADISKKLSDKIKKTTRKIYTELGARGIIRIDYFIVGDKVFVNEINTVPGSLAYYLFSDTLKGFTNILNSLIRAAEKEFAIESSLIKSYDSGVLTSSGFKGAKKK